MNVDLPTPVSPRIKMFSSDTLSRHVVILLGEVPKVNAPGINVFLLGRSCALEGLRSVGTPSNME
jgi:hypothetical protein